MNRRRGGQRRQPLLVAVLRPELDRVEDAEDRWLRAFPRIEAEITDAARDDQADVGVLDPAFHDAFFDHPSHGVFGYGNLQPDCFRRGIQTVEVGIQAEDAAAVGADALENAVAIQEAVVEYGNDRAAAVVP